MPYIDYNGRTRLSHISGVFPDTPGELNFCITKLIQNYLFRDGITYHRLNDVVGALECAKLELYRRKIIPYEDKKIIENGDVW